MQPPQPNTRDLRRSADLLFPYLVALLGTSVTTQTLKIIDSPKIQCFLGSHSSPICPTSFFKEPYAFSYPALHPLSVSSPVWLRTSAIPTMFGFRLAQFVFEGFWHSPVFSGSFRSSFCRSSGTSLLESAVQHALKFSFCSATCAAREEGSLEASETGPERVYRRCHLASWLAAGWPRNKDFIHV